MNYRFMRLILFFDLPVETTQNRRDYTAFHKFLIKTGFIMMQKSVYSKLVINGVTSQAVRELIKKNLPPEGLIELLEVTENQFSRIEYLIGESQSCVLGTTDRLVEV